MKKREIYNYRNPIFAELNNPMRKVMSAYGEAEKYFAAIKEVTWSRFGFKALTDYIHALEHIQPEAIDTFKDILADYGLEVEYPATEELDTDELTDVDKIFETCVEIIDNTDSTLRFFINACDEGNEIFYAIARKAENLLMDNSTERRFLLEAWAMYDNEASEASFDKWVSQFSPANRKRG